MNWCEVCVAGLRRNEIPIEGDCVLLLPRRGSSSSSREEEDARLSCPL